MGGEKTVMRALVTGATGFLGRRIVELLRERGDEVVAFVRRPDSALEATGARLAIGDLRDSGACDAACRGVEAVFHAGAVTGIWGPRRLFWETNVEGTRHVIAACRAAGVPRLIFTSSPSVVFGEDDLRGVDERQPYPDRYLAYYPESKAVAERSVLAANGSDLATVCLRPHLIWGPGDPHLIPRVVARARAGRLVQVGDGTNLVDITYIDNAAEAHLLAGDSLELGGRCAGRVYFVGQSEPVRLWDWLNDLLRAFGVPCVTRSISYAAARRIGRVLELAHRGLRLPGEPRMTRFLAAQLAKSHYFDHSAAAKDFGFHPRVSTEEGVRRLVVAWRSNEAPHRDRVGEPSSAVVEP